MKTVNPPFTIYHLLLTISLTPSHVIPYLAAPIKISRNRLATIRFSPGIIIQVVMSTVSLLPIVSIEGWPARRAFLTSSGVILILDPSHFTRREGTWLAISGTWISGVVPGTEAAASWINLICFSHNGQSFC